MKYAIVFLLGIATAIGGEFLMPERYSYPIARGCFKGPANPTLTFLPGVRVVDSKRKDGFIDLYTKESIPSYSVLKDFLLGDISRLSQEECNAVINKALNDGEKK